MTERHGRSERLQAAVPVQVGRRRLRVACKHHQVFQHARQRGARVGPMLSVCQMLQKRLRTGTEQVSRSQEPGRRPYP